MQRRQFLELSTLAAATRLRLLASLPMPMATLGKTGLKVSRYVVGGYHMNVKGEETAQKILRRARELGVNFFDSANAYHKGESDRILGRVFGASSQRQQVHLMTKCELYTRDAAMKLLEEQLQRMKTDYLDLWQCHQVSEMKEVDQIFAPGGSLEAFVQAKKQGKVRHIGFTGHRDPAIHLRLLQASEWETIQMPINLIDPHYLSFLTNVLPAARKKGLGVLAMKSNAMGAITQNKVARIEDCLRFTASQDVDVVVSGAETVEQLEQNLLAVKTLKKMTQAEITELLGKTKQGQTGVKIERYKRPPESAAAWPLHRDGD
jgi:aryl-alcohol dehydrogenase-like predicted oxidoreductase